MQNSNSKSRAEAQQSTEADVPTSSSHNAKPHISGCKILAFESGGDWADASVEYMVNISGRSGEELFEEYCGNGGYHGNGKTWFKEWTIEKGYCREGSDDEIEVVSDL